MATWYVSLTAAGSGSGVNWANNAAWSNISSIYNSATFGDEIILEAGFDYPAPATAIQLTKQINWRGQNRNGIDQLATILGNRTWPWPANGMWTNSGQYNAATEGQVVFQLASAGTNVFIRFLAFRNVKYGVQALLPYISDTATINYEDCKAFNASGAFLWTEATTDGQVSGSYLRCKAWGYSKGAGRHFGSITATDSFFDAQSQFHTPTTNLFGLHAQDLVVGYTSVGWTANVTRCIFNNHDGEPPADASPAPGNPYPQGDGMVCEENVTSIFTDVLARHAADRGIDLKCSATITRAFITNCGYGVGAHNGAAIVSVNNSYFGTGYRRNINDSNGISPLQASGQLQVRNSVVENAPVSVGPSQNFRLAEESVNPPGVQSNIITPVRIGVITLNDSQTRTISGMTTSNGKGTEAAVVAVIKGLNPVSNYSFTVAAIDAAGNIYSQSSVLTITTLAAYTNADTQAPVAPTGLVVGSVSTTTANLTWTLSTDNVAVSGYLIMINGLPANLASGSNYQISGLLPGTSYDFQVCAYDETSNFSTASNTVTVTTDTATTAATGYAAPTSLSADFIGPSAVLLSWNKPVGTPIPSGYLVYSSGTPVAHTYAGTIYKGTYTTNNVQNLIKQGVWSSTTTYAVNDIVSYATNNYVALQGNTNAQPDINRTQWLPIV